MRQIQYTAGKWVSSGPKVQGWQTQTDPGDIEQARRALAKMAGETSNEEWISNPPMLLKRFGPNHPWEPVADPARDEVQQVLLRLAEEFRKIGTGIVQGVDLYHIFNSVARRATAPSLDPEEFDS